MMKHKGYAGDAQVDLDAGVIRGRVIGLKDVITFQGLTVEEARAAFVDSVEDYLAFCAERGEKPEKPFSGKILVRLDPNLHRELSMTAEKTGLSINTLVVEAVTKTWGSTTVASS
jgi:predicted HicB family RNase H-like nuclease